MNIHLGDQTDEDIQAIYFCFLENHEPSKEAYELLQKEVPNLTIILNPLVGKLEEQFRTVPWIVIKDDGRSYSDVYGIKKFIKYYKEGSLKLLEIPF